MFERGGIVRGVSWALPACFWCRSISASLITCGSVSVFHLVHVVGASFLWIGTSIAVIPDLGPFRRDPSFRNIALVASVLLMIFTALAWSVFPCNR